MIKADSLHTTAAGKGYRLAVVVEESRGELQRPAPTLLPPHSRARLVAVDDLRPSR